ncbi:MAG: Gfo/Idh/MocA family protein [Terriglobales bacterium]
MLKVAIAGFGFMGKTHAAACARLPGAKLVAVGDVRQESFAHWKPPYPLAFFTDLDRLLADSGADVLDICLPTFLHEEFVTKAAARGLHVLCEKPLALTVAEADRMLGAVRKAGVGLMVAQVLRFFPHYRAAREMFQRGELGDVFFASAARLSEPPQWAAWFRDPHLSGGALYDLQIHDLDYLMSLFGLPLSVTTRGVQSDSGCWNHVVSVLTYPGRTVSIEASYRMPLGWPFSTSLRLVGTGAALEYGFRVNGNVDALKHAQHSFKVYPSAGAVQTPEVADSDPYLDEIAYFLECVQRRQQPSMVPPEESRSVIAVLELCKRSLETGMSASLSDTSVIAGR